MEEKYMGIYSKIFDKLHYTFPYEGNQCLYFSVYCSICIGHVWLYIDTYSIKIFRNEDNNRITYM